MELTVRVSRHISRVGEVLLSAWTGHTNANAQDMWGQGCADYTDGTFRILFGLWLFWFRCALRQLILRHSCSICVVLRFFFARRDREPCGTGQEVIMGKLYGYGSDYEEMLGVVGN